MQPRRAGGETRDAWRMRTRATSASIYGHARGVYQDDTYIFKITYRCFWLLESDCKQLCKYKEFRTRYQTLASLSEVILEGEEVAFLSFDLMSAYHSCAIAESDRKYFGFCIDGRHYQCSALPFGWNAPPYIFNAMDAFSVSWAGERCWVNADWDSLPEVAQRLEEEPAACATVVCPYFPGELWFQRLRLMSADMVVVPWDPSFAEFPHGS